MSHSSLRFFGSSTTRKSLSSPETPPSRSMDCFTLSAARLFGILLSQTQCDLTYGSDSFLNFSGRGKTKAVCNSEHSTLLQLLRLDFFYLPESVFREFGLGRRSFPMWPSGRGRAELRRTSGTKLALAILVTPCLP